MAANTAEPPVRPNLLTDQPLSQAPNSIWVSDIDYLPLNNGERVYLATWLYLYSRKVMG
ncbi:hypothetical protein [Spirosoma knui]